MAFNTVTLQGSFISTGSPQFIPFPSGVDWIQVYNTTQIGTSPNPSVVFEAYWQRPMLQGSAIVMTNTAGSNVLNSDVLLTNGFTYIDTTNPPLNPPIAITAGTNATRPVYSTANTANLGTGSIVRVTNLATTPNLNGYDFSIDTVVANTSFRVKNALANAPGAVSGAGTYRLISANPFLPGVSYWYPSTRRIVNISQAASAVVTTSVDSSYIPGQLIRLVVPAVFGMTQADGLLVTVLAVNGGDITVDLDTTGFSPFVFPLVAAYPFTPAETTPVGETTNPIFDPNLLTDATFNTGQTGLILGAGVSGPAGQIGDAIVWIGGKTFNGS